MKSILWALILTSQVALGWGGKPMNAQELKIKDFLSELPNYTCVGEFYKNQKTLPWEKESESLEDFFMILRTSNNGLLLAQAVPTCESKDIGQCGYWIRSMKWEGNIITPSIYVNLRKVPCPKGARAHIEMLLKTKYRNEFDVKGVK